MSPNNKLVSSVILVAALFLAVFVYPQGWDRIADVINGKIFAFTKVSADKAKLKIPHFFSVPPFRLGLDLLGGTHLVYQADLSNPPGGGSQDVGDAMAGVRDVIERRVNLFGVSEPLVQIEGKDRLVVELAGIKDTNQAIRLIGQTPFLEFKEELTKEESTAIIQKFMGKEANGLNSDHICGNVQALVAFLFQYGQDPCFKSSGLSGRQLTRAQLSFDGHISGPQVNLELNDDGAKLFAEITKRNLNKRVAIYLDGQPISIPIVQSEIPNGNAVISGRFSIQEAKDLANRLNAGALPVPISLISQQTIGPSLGADSLAKSLRAGLYGLLMVALFMLIYYRLPGVVSIVALLIYIVIVLAIYKLIPVTLTLAGIAGFILSLGIAVDANILIFARMREELKAGKPLSVSVNEGFHRAWYSIRDSHVTTILGAAMLYAFSTSVVKGFALTLGIGVLISLFTATVVARNILKAIVGPRLEKNKWLF